MAVPVGDSFSAVGALEAQDEAGRRAWLDATVARLVSSLGAMTNRGMVSDQQQWQRGFSERQAQSDADYRKQYMAQALAPTEASIARATRDADTGAFGSPEDIFKMYPKMGEAEAAALLRRSTEARRSIEDEYNLIRSAADTLNRRQLISSYIPLSEEAIGGAAPGLLRFMAKAAIPGGVGSAIARGPLGGDMIDFEQRRIADWKNELGQLGPAAARIEGNRQLLNSLRLDPETGRYAPAMSAPSWLQAAPGAAAGSAAPPPGPAGPSRAGMMRSAPQYQPAFYQRVNELVAQGLNPVDAKRKAIAEFTPITDEPAAGMIDLLPGS